MVIEEERIRATHIVYNGSMKMEYADPLVIPEYTVGSCQGILSSRRVCLNYGDLGDGLCINCWDKSYQARITKLRIRRQIKKELKELECLVRS